MSNQYTKFEYKRIKNVGITDFKNQTSLNISFENISKLNTPQQIRKYLSNVYQIKVLSSISDNNFAKLEYKEMKTVGITDYTNQTHQSILDGKMSKFNIPKIRKHPLNVHKIEDAYLRCVYTV